MGSQTTVNDVLFYVPYGSLIVFRATVAQCRDRQNLHWVSDVPEVTSVLWLEYDFNHPSNTQKSSNPRYKMTDRPEATDADHYGKFHEHKLRQREEYQSLHAAFLNRHGARQMEFWSRSVRQLLQEVCGLETRGIGIHFFKSQWYRFFPNIDLGWCQSRHGLTGSLRDIHACKVVETPDGALLTYLHPRRQLLSSRSTCDLCGYTPLIAPLWRCQFCTACTCPSCLDIKCDLENPQCKYCAGGGWDAPWRKHKRGVDDTLPVAKKGPGM